MAVPASESRETPTVSVLICTKDRRDDVARALASLRAAGVEREGVEIVVVEETARPQPITGVRYVPLPPEGRGFAHVRNRAVDAAKGSLLGERISARWPCRYAPTAIVYHKPRQRLAAIFPWFVRRGRAELRILPGKARPGAVVLALVRSSTLLRVLALAVVMAWLPWPVAVTLPIALGLYYARLLWRYAFAWRYPTHRRGFWLAPLVRVIADAGAEVGRLREAPSVLRRWWSARP